MRSWPDIAGTWWAMLAAASLWLTVHQLAGFHTMVHDHEGWTSHLALHHTAPVILSMLPIIGVISLAARRRLRASAPLHVNVPAFVSLVAVAEAVEHVTSAASHGVAVTVVLVLVTGLIAGVLHGLGRLVVDAVIRLLARGRRSWSRTTARQIAWPDIDRVIERRARIGAHHRRGPPRAWSLAPAAA